MLVSKIKPCMSQYESLHGETANGSLKEFQFIWLLTPTWIPAVILELIHAHRIDFEEDLRFLALKPDSSLTSTLVNHKKIVDRMASADGIPYRILTYQLPTVMSWITVAMTGNGGLGFDFGEGALETATTSKEGSRHANYPILIQGGGDKE